MNLIEKTNILVDLLPAQEGYAGIPQEARLLFKVLAQQSSHVEAGGLIYTNSPFSIKYQVPPLTGERDELLFTANFLAELAESKVNINASSSGGLLAKILKQQDRLKMLLLLLKSRHFTLKEIDAEHFFGFIWRVLFSKTLLPEDMPLLRKQRYFISALNSRSMRMAAMLKSKATLDTTGWDFAMFQFMRPVKVSPGTTKLVRYHDSIALQDTDVCVPKGSFTQGHELIHSLDDSFYVCNSEPTRESLLKLAPELENKSATIGLILASYNKVLSREMLLNIIRRGFSSSLLPVDKQVAVYHQLKSQPDFSYILIIATLEPRKNYLTLIRAWERLKAQGKISHRLMIVGNEGWNNTAIMQAMRPHVIDGDILHLEKIHPEDMGYLYSHADAFVFPSYNEGFGCPPLEALQCECPVIVSDIDTHRWVLGDAALYCNPYDVNSLVHQLERLLISAESESLRQTLIEKSKPRLEAFSAGKIGEQWTVLLETLKAKHKAS